MVHLSIIRENAIRRSKQIAESGDHTDCSAREISIYDELQTDSGRRQRVSFFCFYKFLRVLKGGPYIRVDDAIFLTDFFRSCPSCEAPNNSVYWDSSPESPACHDGSRDRL